MDNDIKYLVIGISTGSRDIETWEFDDPILCGKFCEKLARDTGRMVYIIDGKVIAKYEVELPVKVTYSADNLYQTGL